MRTTNKSQLTIIIATFIIILAIINTSNNIYASGPTIDDKLRNLDRALDHAVSVCEKETYKTMCADTLEDSWWIDCSEWYDKLDTCKNGKIENFLKSVGRPT